MADPQEPLNGRRLAEAAYPVCQELDPNQKGLKPGVIEEAVTGRGINIAGPNRRQVLNNALNKAQDLYRGGSNYTWIWTEPSYDPRRGLSGAALAEEAYRILYVRDPGRAGMHYAKMLQLLLEDGVAIRGGNRGNTLFTALQNADVLFEWTGSGTFRVRR